MAEFVEYHQSLGFSRIYALDGGLTSESRQVLQTFPQEKVKVLSPEPDNGGLSRCLREIGTDYGIEGPDKAKQHVWVFPVDPEEFVAPFAFDHSVPKVLTHYEHKGALHLHLEKVWFGGGWTQNVEGCKEGPLLARFVRYGTQEQSREGSDMHLAGARIPGVKIGARRHSHC